MFGTLELVQHSQFIAVANMSLRVQYKYTFGVCCLVFCITLILLSSISTVSCETSENIVPETYSFTQRQQQTQPIDSRHDNVGTRLRHAIPLHQRTYYTTNVPLAQYLNEEISFAELDSLIHSRSRHSENDRLMQQRLSDQVEREPSSTKTSSGPDPDPSDEDQEAEDLGLMCPVQQDGLLTPFSIIVFGTFVTVFLHLTLFVQPADSLSEHTDDIPQTGSIDEEVHNTGTAFSRRLRPVTRICGHLCDWRTACSSRNEFLLQIVSALMLWFTFVQFILDMADVEVVEEMRRLRAAENPQLDSFSERWFAYQCYALVIGNSPNTKAAVISLWCAFGMSIYLPSLYARIRHVQERFENMDEESGDGVFGTRSSQTDDAHDVPELNDGSSELVFVYPTGCRMLYLLCSCCLSVLALPMFYTHVVPSLFLFAWIWILPLVVLVVPAYAMTACISNLNKEWSRHSNIMTTERPQYRHGQSGRESASLLDASSDEADSFIDAASELDQAQLYEKEVTPSDSGLAAAPADSSTLESSAESESDSRSSDEVFLCLARFVPRHTWNSRLPLFVMILSVVFAVVCISVGSTMTSRLYAGETYWGSAFKSLLERNAHVFFDRANHSGEHFFRLMWFVV
jgi:hypothetical protein